MLLQLPLTGLEPPSDSFSPDLGADTAATTGVGGVAESLISTVLGAVTIIAGLLFMAMFFLGAINWMTSGGDSGKVASARNRMIQGVIGLLVVVASYAAIGLIGQLVGIDILNLSGQLVEITPN